MIRTSLFIIAFAILFESCGQRQDWESYVNSFDNTDKNKILNFRQLSAEGIELSEANALKFITQNDTSKLYCAQEIVNLETEEKLGISTDIYLPRKALKLVHENFVIIGHTLFKCDGPTELVTEYLQLKLLHPKTYSVTDSLVTYIGNDYDWTTNGLLNTTNGNIFLVRTIMKSQDKELFLYSVDKDHLKFKIISYHAKQPSISGDLDKILKRLNWLEPFNAE